MDDDDIENQPFDPLAVSDSGDCPVLLPPDFGESLRKQLLVRQFKNYSIEGVAEVDSIKLRDAKVWPIFLSNPEPNTLRLTISSMRFESEFDYYIGVIDDRGRGNVTGHTRNRDISFDIRRAAGESGETLSGGGAGAGRGRVSGESGWMGEWVTRCNLENLDAMDLDLESDDPWKGIFTSVGSAVVQPTIERMIRNSICQSVRERVSEYFQVSRAVLEPRQVIVEGTLPDRVSSFTVHLHWFLVFFGLLSGVVAAFAGAFLLTFFARRSSRAFEGTAADQTLEGRREEVSF